MRKQDESPPEIELRLGTTGDWIPAAKVKGLFPSQPKPHDSAHSQRLPVLTPSETPPPLPKVMIPNSASVPAKVQDRIPCPFCGEMIVSSAVKCWHCDKFLDRRQHDVDVIGAIYSMKGVQDVLAVFEDRVTITPKGVLGFLNKGIKGTKEIPFASIVAVQFKEAGAVFSGYLQFSILGGYESRGGILAAAQDENTFMFAHPKNNPLAKEIKEHIDSAVRRSRTPQPTAPSTNLSDELRALAKLKAEGILSDKEFQAAKKRLIG